LVSAPNAPNGSGQDGRTATSDFYQTPDNLLVRTGAALETGDRGVILMSRTLSSTAVLTIFAPE
jgi:hypothetical protein